jgi:LmbE family N-acetylglucosaminyl deacetylase
VRQARWVAVAAAVALIGVLPTAAQARPRSGPIDLDVMFIGAHPDDEAGGLAVYGQWGEQYGLRTGVITVTRGEGGGNAVGPEEGPALGLLREDEERRAVGKVEVRNIYNLDDVDFYYTVSGPLTEEVWGRRGTLEKVVRVLRRTRPDVIVTMDPSPTPGNHGHHQIAARLAVEAFDLAADPSEFPDQISKEGLEPWRVKRIFRNGSSRDTTKPPPPTGPACETTFSPAEPTDETFGVWGGRTSAKQGKTWAQIEREAQRVYASQGWHVFPDVPTDPAQIGCDRWTQIDSRVPYDPKATTPDAMLQGALRPAPGGLPRGTELYLTSDRFDVAPGQETEVTAHVRATRALRKAKVELALPDGWTGGGTKAVGTVTPGREKTATFTVTVPDDARTNARVRLQATLETGGDSGETTMPLRVVPQVRGTVAPLPHVGQFRDWVAEIGAQQLDTLVDLRAGIGVAETAPLRIDLQNFSQETQSGTVELRLPDGFEADATSKSFSGLAAGEKGSVTFEVTNTDTSLKTSNEGGDYGFDVVTTAGGATSTTRGLLNLVPITDVPQASGTPTVDGTEGAGEYGAPALDLSRLWEGQQPSSPADASGSAKVTWADDALYLLVNVNDDVLGTVLPASDAKRHWRTDSVEVALDPQPASENTSTTFKVGVFPTTQEGGPAAYRDADNHQGPIAETAPGMEVASRVRQPYDGYTLEMKIPLAHLPAAARANWTGLNVFIYDSDTQDKTGQSRLGWSTWGGVQGDPYRWGHARLNGYQAPPDRPTTPREPIFPREVARSVLSPQSILQSAEDGVPLAGQPAASPRDRAFFVGRPVLSDDALSVRLLALGPGTAYAFATGPDGKGAAFKQVEIEQRGLVTVRIPLDAEQRQAVAGGHMAVAFEARGGGTVSLAAPLR